MYFAPAIEEKITYVHRVVEKQFSEVGLAVIRSAWYECKADALYIKERMEQKNNLKGTGFYLDIETAVRKGE